MLSDPAKAAAGGVSREECAVATYEGATVVAGGVIARISYLFRRAQFDGVRHCEGDAPELDANAGPILLGVAKGGIALRATPELIGEIAQDPTFSKELEETLMLEVILKRFEKPDEVRTFEKGKFELLQVGGMTIGRATYEPGWKWSVHVGQGLGKKSCDVEHVGMVISGRATAAMDDGRVIEMKRGDVFYIAPGHDSWVVGDETYVSIHLLGAGDYAAHK